MVRHTSQTAVEKLGNRFYLVLVAAKRARELKEGAKPRIDNPDSNHSITALMEIEQGLYTIKDYVESLPKKKKGQRDEYYT